MKLKLEHKKDLILSKFNEGLKVADIAKLIGEYEQPVSNLIKRYTGVKSLKPKITNENYFSNIDTKSKAYILGFIAADGALVDRVGYTTALTITLKYTDSDVLRFIQSELGSNHKLTEIIRPSSFDNDKIIHHIRLAFANKQISSDLRSLGIEPCKSTTMSDIIRNIPFEFRDAFIIGYFDGDGSVSTINTFKTKTMKDGSISKYPCYNLSVNIRGTFDFLNGIVNHLNINPKFIRQYDSIPQLTFANKKDLVKFFKCYDGLDFYYKRKHDVFLSRINHKSYDKYK